MKGVKYTPGNLFVKFSKPIKYEDIKDLSIEEIQEKVNDVFRENNFVKTDEEIYKVDYDIWLTYFVFWLIY